MINWYTGLSPWLRFTFALIPLGISTVMYFGGWFWPWGWGVGTVMLCFSFPSDSEKKGYRF